MPVNGHAEEASVGGTSHEVPPSWHLIGPLPRPIHWREHLQGFKGVKPYVIPISNRSRTIRSLFVSAPPPGAFSRQGRWGVAGSRNESESELCTDAVSPSHLPPRASRGRRGRGGSPAAPFFVYSTHYACRGSCQRSFVCGLLSSVTPLSWHVWERTVYLLLMYGMKDANTASHVIHVWKNTTFKSFYWNIT